MPAYGFCGAHFTLFSCIFLSFNLCSYSLSASLSLLWSQGFHFELIEDLQRTVYTWSTYSSQPSALTNFQQLTHLPHHCENSCLGLFPSTHQHLSVDSDLFFFTVRGLPANPSSPASNRKGSESIRYHKRQRSDDIFNVFVLFYRVADIHSYQAWSFLFQ